MKFTTIALAFALAISSTAAFAAGGGSTGGGSAGAEGAASTSGSMGTVGTGTTGTAINGNATTGSATSGVNPSMNASGSTIGARPSPSGSTLTPTGPGSGLQR